MPVGGGRVLAHEGSLRDPVVQGTRENYRGLYGNTMYAPPFGGYAQSSSSRHGGSAPRRPHVIAAALCAYRTAAANCSPVSPASAGRASRPCPSRLASSPDMNASPAPTVSTTVTGSAGRSTGPPGPTAYAPSGPRGTTTTVGPISRHSSTTPAIGRPPPI